MINSLANHSGKRQCAFPVLCFGSLENELTRVKMVANNVITYERLIT